MTKEIKEKAMTLEEMRSEIETKIAEINAAYSSKDYESQVQLATDIAECAANYNVALRHAEYDKFLAEEKPVYTALKQGSIPQISISKSKKKDTEITVYALKETTVCVNLIELNEYSEKHGALFVSGQWIAQCELMAKLVAEKMAIDTGAKCVDTIRKNFALSADALSADAQFQDMPQKLSNKSLKKAMQTIVDNIIECEENTGIMSQDLSFLCWCIGKLSNKARHTLVSPRRDTVARIMTEILIKKINNGEYDVEFLSANRK